MSMTRRTAAKASLFSLMATAFGAATGMAKDNRPGGFGATASVSVNSGNNSGNQTFQENQAILTMDSGGNVQVQQGAASGGTVRQGAVASLPSADGTTTPDCGCGNDIPSECAVLGISIGNSEQVYYVPFRCVRYYCQGGS